MFLANISKPGGATIINMTLKQCSAKFLTQCPVENLCMSIKKFQTARYLFDNCIGHGIARKRVININPKILDTVLRFDDMTIINNRKISDFMLLLETVSSKPPCCVVTRMIVLVIGLDIVQGSKIFLNEQSLACLTN